MQDEAHVCIQLAAAAAGRLVTLVYLHPEPVYIHVHTSAPLSSFPAYLRRRRSVRFHVTARGGVAAGGRRASLSAAAVWSQLSGCDKESRKTERFHTNYGKRMKPWVKGRRKVRLSLVGSENNPSESICKVNRNYQKKGSSFSLWAKANQRGFTGRSGSTLWASAAGGCSSSSSVFSGAEEKNAQITFFFFFLKIEVSIIPAANLNPESLTFFL